MTTLSEERRVREEKWAYKSFPLANVAVYKGGAACLNVATGYVTKGAASTTLKTIGTFAESVDNSGGSNGDKSVTVKLARELTVYRFANGTAGDAIAATDIGKPCYWLDDQTVSILPTAHSMAGIIWDVDATKGVAVELFVTNDQGLAAPTITSFANALHTHADAANGGTLTNPIISGFTSANHDHSNQAGGGAVRMATGATLSFTGVTCSLTATNWAYYLVPATGTQASKIVVAATGTAGDKIVFLADGTNNTQTVTYYSGTYAMTSALTSSKTHYAEAVFNGTNWIFSAYVGP